METILSSESNWSRLCEIGKTRWLTSSEIYHLMLSPCPLTSSACLLPPSGTLCLYDKKQVKDYKKDGYCWILKKGTKHVREDNVKLIVENVKRINCSYAHSSATVTFSRRCYRLLESKASLVMVHYLDTRLIKSKTERIDLTLNSVASFSTSPLESLSFELNDTTKNSVGCPSSFDSNCPSFASSLSPSFESSLSPNFDSNYSPNFDSSFDPMLSFDNDVQLDDLFMNDNMMLLDPPVELMNDSTLPFLVVEPHMVEIVDYSPDWDLKKGGANVLVVLSTAFPIWLERDDVRVQFGKQYVDITWVSDSVLKCIAPPRDTGLVQFRAVIIVPDGYTPITEEQSFTYRTGYSTDPIASSSRQSVKSALRSTMDTPVDWDERKFKIRVVEKLSEFHRTRNNESKSEKNRDSCLSNNELLDDTAVAEAGDEDLEVLSEALIKQVVLQLITLAESSDELHEELDTLDTAGLSLLHYVCFYNYTEILPLLISHGANVNQLSSIGFSGLHLAASCGHIEIIEILLTHHADPDIRDANGYSAAHRAEMNYYSETASYLNRITGETSSSPPRPPQNDDGPYGHNSPFLLNSQVQNHTLLVGAFSSLTLHDKCALSLSMSKHHDVDETAYESGSDGYDTEVASVITESDVCPMQLDAAMKLMAPEELAILEEDAKTIQNNVRAWLLRRSYRNMRDSTMKLQEATTKIKLSRERAAVTVQAATRSMLARKSFLQHRNVAIRFQAATRGVLCRKKFSQMKKNALASLVIQKNIRAWLENPNYKRTQHPMDTTTMLTPLA